MRIQEFALLFFLGLAVFHVAGAHADAVADGRQLADAADKATEAGDFAKAADLYRQALARRPNHPGLTLRFAAASARAGRADDAMRALEDYAAMGLLTDMNQVELKSLGEHARLPALKARLADNAKPLGVITVAATINEPQALAEGIAHDAATGRVFIGLVNKRKILAVDPTGSATTFVPQQAHGLLGAFGLALRGDALWVASSALPQVANLLPAEKGQARVLAFGLDGRLKKVVALMSDGKDHVLGDLAVASDGELFTTDSIGGGIYRLAPNGEALELWLVSDEFHSPQGAALSADERKLAIADYTNGIHIVDRTTKAHTVLPMPAHTTLHGIDALVRHGRDLIGVQNGVNPQRVIIVRMNASWSAIEGVDVIAANLPEMDEPTLATRAGDDLLVIGNGQWSRYADDGSIIGNQPFAPTRIVRLKLPPARP